MRRSKAQPHAETPSCQSFQPTTNHTITTVPKTNHSTWKRSSFGQAKSDPLLSADQWLKFHDHAVSIRHEHTKSPGRPHSSRTRRRGSA
ncbi:hypothetical protein CSAL01_02151 [Colletotrichum salicis]|uniref:Uncharacterized protein n=1 Tax=Colletotrichum salicis TaxID=1209931 RepID=A0A135UUB3_9PEZI|nr:hypothetical protein CSAL01_02151 [Colletotrichum salicis]